MTTNNQKQREMFDEALTQHKSAVEYTEAVNDRLSYPVYHQTWPHYNIGYNNVRDTVHGVTLPEYRAGATSKQTTEAVNNDSAPSPESRTVRNSNDSSGSSFGLGEVLSGLGLIGGVTYLGSKIFPEEPVQASYDNTKQPSIANNSPTPEMPATWENLVVNAPGYGLALGGGKMLTDWLFPKTVPAYNVFTDPKYIRYARLRNISTMLKSAAPYLTHPATIAGLGLIGTAAAGVGLTDINPERSKQQSTALLTGRDPEDLSKVRVQGSMLPPGSNPIFDNMQL